MMQSPRGPIPQGVVFTLLTAFFSTNAFADEPPQRSDLMVRPVTFIASLERAIAFGPFTQDGPRGQAGIAAGFGPFLRSTELDGSGMPFLPHLVPRIGIDAILWERTSVGLAAGYGFSTAMPSSGTDDTPEVREVRTRVLAGRIGYAHPASPRAVVWTRLGVRYAWGDGEYFSGVYSDEDRNVEIQLASLEAEIVFTFLVANHAAITLGVGLDLGIYGTDRRRNSAGSAQLDGSEVRRVHDGLCISLGALGFF